MSNERTVMFQMPSVLSGTLACIAGTVAGRSWDLSAGTFVIGRLESCDLHLPSEPGVSKTHAKIVAEGDSYVLVDCESRNGTIVNGSPVQRVPLKDGDEIRVCGCVLRFTQRGGNTGIKVRNADPPRAQHQHHSEQVAVDLDIDEVAVPPTAPHMAAQFSNVPSSSASPSFASPTERVHHEERQPPPPPAWDAQPSQMTAAPSYPPRGRVLATWYAGGLVGALLFGGTGTAVLAVTSSPADTVAVAEAGGADGAVAADAVAKDPAAEAVKPAPVGEADTPPVVPPPGDAQPDPAAAIPTPPIGEAKAPEPPKEEPKAPPKEEPKAAEVKVARAEPQREEPRERRREQPAETNADGGGKSYPATAEGGRSETLRAKGGKVKSVEVREGDIVGKGEVIVTFEDGDNSEEIATLRDRVASLEGVDEDEARRDLKAAKAKLDALTSTGGGPVIAGMAGRLTGFSVSAGQVLKNGEVIGRVVEGEAPKRVKVRVDRSTKVRRGQEAILVLRRGGEAPGTVSSVSGRNVTVETGEIAADEVASVKF